MASQFEGLSKYTIVVEDTGEIDEIEKTKPRDATTNPSLILKAVHDERYQDITNEALDYARNTSGTIDERVDACIAKLFVGAGLEILKIVKGRVSTEVPTNLSYDTEASIAKAHELIGLYEEAGESRDRVLIKVASTWEGIRAAEQLEKEGIHCNLTLLFSFAQAVACAEAHVTLISPFVGRIYDWYKKDQGVDDIPIEDDPGVASVTKIYNYFKKFDYKTEVMGASFRKAAQCVHLAGCDLLTISPDLIAELKDTEGDVPRKLDPDKAKATDIDKIHLEQKDFRWLHNSDPMAVDKLAEGIRKFDADLNKLKAELKSKLEG